MKALLDLFELMFNNKGQSLHIFSNCCRNLLFLIILFTRPLFLKVKYLVCIMEPIYHLALISNNDFLVEFGNNCIRCCWSKYVLESFGNSLTCLKVNRLCNEIFFEHFKAGIGGRSPSGQTVTDKKMNRDEIKLTWTAKKCRLYSFWPFNASGIKGTEGTAVYCCSLHTCTS